MIRWQSLVANRGLRHMGFAFSKCSLGGIALLAVACTGQDILLTMGNGGSGGSAQEKEIRDLGRGGAANGGNDTKGGGPNFLAGTGNAGGSSKGGSDFGNDGLAGSAGDAPVDGNTAGAAGTSDPGPEHGGWLAYDLDLASATGQRQIQILRTDGSCARQLVWPTNGGKVVKQPAFSTDGKHIAFAGDDSTGIFQIFVMDLVSGVRRQLTNEFAGASYPSWTPTGDVIAYVTGDPEDKFDREHPLGSGSEVALVNVATTMKTVLGYIGQPAYTASAFVNDTLLLVGNSLSVTGIHTDTRARYSAAPQTAFAPTLTSPSISPDKSWFALSAGCGTQSQLYVARVDGSTGDICENATPLAANSDGLITTSWGPSGYIAAETSHHDIVLVPSDGSNGIQVLVNNPHPERNPAFAPASVSLDCAD